MGSGQSAANTMTSAAGNLGQNEASNAYNAGQARASGYMGVGNALSSAIGSATNAYMQAPMLEAQTNYLNSMASRGGGGGGGPTTGIPSYDTQPYNALFRPFNPYNINN